MDSCFANALIFLTYPLAFYICTHQYGTLHICEHEQLIVNEDVLSQHAVIDILAISWKIVGHFKHSTLAYHRLNEIQDKLTLDKHRLVQDKPTRWNSTLYMLQSIYTQKMALAAYSTEYDSINMLSTHQLIHRQKNDCSA